jgi:hypothetical protein
MLLAIETQLNVGQYVVKWIISLVLHWPRPFGVARSESPLQLEHAAGFRYLTGNTVTIPVT